MLLISYNYIINTLIEEYKRIQEEVNNSYGKNSSYDAIINMFKPIDVSSFNNKEESNNS